MRIYTIGHSTRSAEEFLALLNNYKIDIVMDVRRFPQSQKFPQYNQQGLEKYLKKSGIKYCWLGDSLGGYRKGGYEKYTKTAEFKEGLNKLLSCARAGQAAIMCAEALWFRCHRRFIAEALVRKRHKILHILDAKHTYEHKFKKQ